MVTKVEEFFEYGNAPQSLFLFVIIFIYVFMLLLFVFSTEKLTSTSHVKA
jgi:hypothetical protein